MNTEDRDTYDFEITGLRKSNVLTEIRSSPAAQQISRQRRIPKSRVPRFRVSNPLSAKPGLRDGMGRLPTPVAEPSRELYPEETGVFVGNLDPATTEDELRTVLQRFGRVRKVIASWDKRPGVPSRYAVLWLETADEANRALDALYGFKLNGRELRVQRFRAKRPR